MTDIVPGVTSDTTTTTTIAPWHSTINATEAGFSGDAAASELAGYLKNRGYDAMTPDKAVALAIKSHREAEKLVGAPANEILRMPKDANDQEGWQRFNARVGVPADAKEYDFSAVKLTDGTALDDGFIAALAPALKDARVPKDAAPAVAKAIVNFLEKSELAETNESVTALQNEKEALGIKWGSNVEANLMIARQTAKTLGVTPEQIAAAEKVLGYSNIMEMFRNIGTKIGEDSFVKNPSPGGSGVMSKDQAAAQLAERQNDQEWVGKLLAGDPTVTKEFHNLTQIKAQKAA